MPYVCVEQISYQMAAYHVAGNALSRTPAVSLPKGPSFDFTSPTNALIDCLDAKKCAQHLNAIALSDQLIGRAAMRALSRSVAGNAVKFFASHGSLSNQLCYFMSALATADSDPKYSTTPQNTLPHPKNGRDILED
jgi:hypothetical protein